MLDVFLDVVLDSLKVFGVAFLFFFLFSFVEHKISYLLQKHKRLQPLLGAGCGLIPECGISVVAVELYKERRITAGTLFAVFFACSDSALLILFTDTSKMIYIFPLILIKFIFGFLLGYFIDYVIFRKSEHKEDVFISKEEESKVFRHFWHPLFHSLKLFAYVFIISLLFGILIYYIGEQQMISFLSSNLYVTPLFAGIVGLIPNCASTTILCELFIKNGLPFGALTAGLCTNAGIGIFYLLQLKVDRKNNILFLGILFLYSVCIGYGVLWIMR